MRKPLDDMNLFQRQCPRSSSMSDHPPLPFPVRMPSLRRNRTFHPSCNCHSMFSRYRSVQLPHAKCNDHRRHEPMDSPIIHSNVTIFLRMICPQAIRVHPVFSHFLSFCLNFPLRPLQPIFHVAWYSTTCICSRDLCFMCHNDKGCYSYPV